MIANGVTGGCHRLGLTAVIVNEEHDATDLQVMRCRVGAQLGCCRRDAGLSQPQLGQVLGRTRSLISKVEHGTRAMPAALWQLADGVCNAQGALMAEYTQLATVEADYRERCRARRHREQIQRAAVYAQTNAVRALPSGVPNGRDDACAELVLASAGLAEDLLAVVVKIIRRLGRREAIRLAGSVLVALGLPGLDLDPDETERVVQAVEAPCLVDAHVIKTLAVTLASCKRLEDRLGPSQVVDTVIAQHHLLHRIQAGCPSQLRKPLSLVDSNMACAIGWYLIEMGHDSEGRGYLEHARQAAHDAAHPAYAAYAACYLSHAAFLRADTPTALDSAAAARSLAARTNDSRLKAFAEQQAAGAYALDGQYSPCLAACDRAHNFLITADGSAPDSPAYWVDHSVIDCKHSTLLSLLGRPQQALDAATAAHTQFNRNTYVRMYGFCQVRLAHALVLSQEINEAAHILGDAANHANLSTRLTQELHATRKLMQPWATTPSVKTLDDQLMVCGLTPTTRIIPGLTTLGDQQE